MRTPFFNAIKQAMTYLIILLVTFIVLEVALIFLDPFLFKGFFQYDPEFGFRVRPHTNGSNEFGFNDIDRPHAKPENTYRIIMLGDSFNWAGGISCNYVGLLGEKLENAKIHGKKIEVINVGYPATGPHEEFLALKKFGLQYNPDMVILGLFAGNDFDDPNKKMIVLNANLYPIDRRQERTLFGFPVIPKSRVVEIIRQHRKILEGVDTKPTQAYRPKKCGPNHQDPQFTEAEFLQLTAAKLRFHNKKHEDEYEPFVDFLARTIRLMKEYLNERHIEFRVAIFPDELQVDPKLLNAAIDHGNHTKSDLDIDHPQRLMHSILSDEDIDFIDLLPVFRTTYSRNPEDSLYLLRNTHWNYFGNELAAESIYQWLEPDLQIMHDKTN